jgi:hypothetical protein
LVRARHRASAKRIDRRAKKEEARAMGRFSVPARLFADVFSRAFGGAFSFSAIE